MFFFFCHEKCLLRYRDRYKRERKKKNKANLNIYNFFYLFNFFSSNRTMRKREFQSFTLKLSDLSEYEAVREQRLKKNTTGTKSNESTPSFIPSLVKYEPKTKQEIRARLGIQD